MKGQRDVHLALSSGSALGLAHVGVIKALLDSGYNIRAISGSSMGAIAATFFAFGFTPEEMVSIAQDTGNKITLFLKAAIGSRGGPGITVESIVNKYIGNASIKDANIPLYVYSTDLITGKPYIFQPDDKVDIALKASSAIPGIFPHVKYKNMLLVDGGVASPVPTSIFHDKEEALLVAVNIYGGIKDCTWNPPPFTMSPVLAPIFSSMRSYAILMANVTSYITVHTDIMLTPPLCGFSSWDFTQAKQIFETAYTYTLDILSKQNK